MATYAYSPQFLDSTGTPIVGAAVTLYAHGDRTTIVASGTTNSSGNLVPSATLTIGSTYDFLTSSGLVPEGRFTTVAPVSLVLITGPAGPPGTAASDGRARNTATCPA